MSGELENIYDPDSMSLLADVARWAETLKSNKKLEYKDDLKANLLPLILQMFQVLSVRITETEKILVETLEDNTLQPEFAERILAVFALGDAALAESLVSTESEAAKKFRAAVAEITPEIQDAVIDVDEDEEGDASASEDGDAEEGDAEEEVA